MQMLHYQEMLLYHPNYRVYQWAPYWLIYYSIYVNTHDELVKSVNAIIA
jgi:hypothetical protein